MRVYTVKCCLKPVIMYRCEHGNIRAGKSTASHIYLQLDGVWTWGYQGGKIAANQLHFNCLSIYFIYVFTGWWSVAMGVLLLDKCCISPVLYMFIYLFAGRWSDCEHHGCGHGGYQGRSVWCAHENGWTAHESDCDQTGRPKETQPCFHVCDFHR